MYFKCDYMLNAAMWYF